MVVALVGDYNYVYLPPTAYMHQGMRTMFRFHRYFWGLQELALGCLGENRRTPVYFSQTRFQIPSDKSQIKAAQLKGEKSEKAVHGVMKV